MPAPPCARGWRWGGQGGAYGVGEIVPESGEGLFFGGHALPHHLAGRVVIGEEVVGDAVQRQVQDASVGAFFQNGETAVQRGPSGHWIPWPRTGHPAA